MGTEDTEEGRFRAFRGFFCGFRDSPGDARRRSEELLQLDLQLLPLAVYKRSVYEEKTDA